MTQSRELLIVAGEVSGDMHAARLVRAITRKAPDVRIYGIGGVQLRAAGVETFQDVRDMAVMGFTEVMRRLPFFWRVFHHLLDIARERHPGAVILVDYPGFNLRFAARAHAMGLKTIYYICPQVWAWNRRRIPMMAAIVNRLLAIFPFEPQVFAGTTLKVDFVGHPLVDEIREALEHPPAILPWSGAPKVALLPGSRVQEIERILPTLLEAAVQIEADRPGASFIIPTPSAEVSQTVRALADSLPCVPAHLAVVEGAARQVLRQADAALVTSGTATLESALLDCPTVVVYKASRLTFFLAKRLVSLPHIGIVNLIAGRRICPEFIQDEATPPRLAAALLGLIEEGPARAEMRKGFAEVRALLGEGGAAERAADLVLQELGWSAAACDGR
jgi:lipid-A-disaccharide synthase